METDEGRSDAEPEEGEPSGQEDSRGKAAGPRTRGSPGGRPPHIVWALVSAVVLVLAAPGLFVAGFFTNELVSDDEGGTTVVAQPSPSPATPPPVVAATADDDPFLGPEDAAVTIIEFSDYQCSFCKRFHDETLDQILDTYEGKIRFVYRDLPLTSIHQYAQKAAEASECADDQGKFWEYHDLIFANQSAIDVDSLKGYAAQLGLDTATFNDCLDGGKQSSEVQNDAEDARASGVTGTPAFFVNGELVAGAIPFEDYPDQSGAMQPGFKSIIDAALEEAE